METEAGHRWSAKNGCISIRLSVGFLDGCYDVGLSRMMLRCCLNVVWYWFGVESGLIGFFGVDV